MHPPGVRDADASCKEEEIKRTMVGALALLGLAAAPVAADVPVTLRGSSESMQRQHAAARALGLPFAGTPGELRELAQRGALVRMHGDRNYQLANSATYADTRPETRDFIVRLAARYHAATGERLVVTSLTRPISRQPANASAISVHPAGMAVDLRVPGTSASREWLERELLALEGQGLLDVTYEDRPPHYHVAVFFPAQYAAYEAAERDQERSAAEQAARGRGTPTAGAAAPARSVPPGAVAGLAGMLAAALVLLRRRRAKRAQSQR